MAEHRRRTQGKIRQENTVYIATFLGLRYRPAGDEERLYKKGGIKLMLSEHLHHFRGRHALLGGGGARPEERRGTGRSAAGSRDASNALHPKDIYI